MPSFDTLKSLHVSVTVWGESYLSLFLRIGVPNLCALVMELPETLRHGSRVRIFTTASDQARLDEAPELLRLRQRIAVEVVGAVEFKDKDRYGDYAPMVVSQARAVVEASREGAGIIFMGPDLIYSAGSFKMFVDCADKGFRVVVGPSIRIRQDRAVLWLAGQVARHPDKLLDIAPGDLADLAFDQWHPANDGYFWDNDESLYWKAYLFCRVGAGDMLMRFFQGPTSFGWPKKEIAEYHGWIDHAFVAMCCDHYAQVYVVRDSTESLSCDLTSERHYQGMARSRYRELDLFKQLLDLRTINRFGIHYGFHTCRVHRPGAADDAWRARARQLAREIDPILKMSLALRPFLRFVTVARSNKPMSIAKKVASRSLKGGANLSLRAVAALLAPFMRGERY